MFDLLNSEKNQTRFILILLFALALDVIPSLFSNDITMLGVPSLILHLIYLWHGAILGFTLR